MAELSPGAVYRYFRSKDEIIQAMEEQGRQRSAAIIEAVTSERTDTLDVLERLVDVFFSKLEDVRDCAVHIELWAEALSNPRIKETVVRIDESIRDAFSRRIVREAQERGAINPGLDPRRRGKRADGILGRLGSSENPRSIGRHLEIRRRDEGNDRRHVLAEDGSRKELIRMLSFLTDELVWAAIREREDEARITCPHTTCWPRTEQAMEPPKPLGGWLSFLSKSATQAPGYR